MRPILRIGIELVLKRATASGMGRLRVHIWRWGGLQRLIKGWNVSRMEVIDSGRVGIYTVVVELRSTFGAPEGCRTMSWHCGLVNLVRDLPNT